MKRSIIRFSVYFLIMQFLLSLYSFPVSGDLPIIASRVSVISEISVVIHSGRIKPNNTLFEMEIVEQILNRDEEEYTVTELGDCFPKAYINASFTNKSLELEFDRMCFDAGTYYTYHSGITREYETLEFFINQSDLIQLPDGNYTLWRPINTASSLGWVDPAEILYTTIMVNSSTLLFIYPEFIIYTIPEFGAILALPIFCSLIVLIVFTHKTSKTKKYLEFN